MKRTFGTSYKENYSASKKPAHEIRRARLGLAERQQVREALQDIFLPLVEYVCKKLEKKVRYIDRDKLVATTRLDDETQTKLAKWSAAQEGSEFILDRRVATHDVFTHLIRKSDNALFVVPNKVWYKDVPFCFDATGAYAIDGEYGSEWAWSLLYGAQALLHDLNKLPLPELKSSSHQKVLDEKTYQGHHGNTILEAIPTMLGTASILTARKVPWYDNPFELLKTIHQSGLVNIWAAGLSFGAQAAMAFSIKKEFPAELIIPKSMPPLHPKRVQFSSAAHGFFRDLHATDRRGRFTYPYEMGGGCPLAFKRSGQPYTAIDRFFGLYIKYVEQYAQTRR